MNPVEGFLNEISELFDKSSNEFINLQKKQDFVFFNIYDNTYVSFFNNELINEILISKSKFFIKGVKFLGLKKVFGEGLVTSDGSKHLEEKRMIQPILNKNNVEKYIPIIIESVKKEFEQKKTNEKINLYTTIKKIALHSTSNCLLGKQSLETADLIEKSVSEVLSRQPTTLFSSYAAQENYSELLTMIGQRQSIQNLHNVILSLIKEKRKNNDTDSDFINLLLKNDVKNFSDKDIVDHVSTMMISGHETSSSLLFWTMFHLSKNKKILKDLKKEVDEIVWLKENKTPTVQELFDTPVCNKILKETLRMYPPVWFLLRQASEEVKIGNVVIPKSMYVVIPLYTIHRSEKYFNNPEEWNPDRWTSDFEKSLPKGSYIPFSEGPRKCPGDNFGMIESQIILLLMIKNYEWFQDSFTHPGFLPLINIKPRNNIHIKIEKREKSEA